MKPISSSGIRSGVGRRLRILTDPVRRKIRRIAPRAESDYATHIPILIGLSKHFRIERVLELGCGEFSTATFLNTECFPWLSSLVSFETDQSWLDRTAQYAGRDQRYHPRLITDTMASAVKDVDLEQFDLIFVDDSTSAAERAETIKQLSKRAPKNPLIVIHDFEIDEYRRAAIGFENRQIFRALTPQTGVIWNGKLSIATILKRLDGKIVKISQRLTPEDIAGWKTFL